MAKGKDDKWKRPVEKANNNEQFSNKPPQAKREKGKPKSDGKEGTHRG